MMEMSQHIGRTDIVRKHRKRLEQTYQLARTVEDISMQPNKIEGIEYLVPNMKQVEKEGQQH